EIEVLAEAVRDGGGQPSPRLVAWIATAKAEQSRLQRSDAGLWAEAARLWEAAGEPYQLARCRWRQAEAMLEASGRRSQAAAVLQRAAGVAAQLGAVPLATSIEQLARRARIPLDAAGTDGVDGTEPPAPMASDFGLTPREAEVL